MKSKFYQSVRERFIRYAKIDTQSCAGADTVPSTQKQFDLAKLLLKELEEMGDFMINISQSLFHEFDN